MLHKASPKRSQPPTRRTDPEREPLIQPSHHARGALASSSLDPPRCGDSHQAAASSSRGATNFIRPVATSAVWHSSQDASFFDSAFMEKVKNSKAAAWASKLAVESEDGLTTAQLMLFNHDLKPVEPERRQWGAWNFVAFWIGMLEVDCFAVQSKLTRG